MREGFSTSGGGTTFDRKRDGSGEAGGRKQVARPRPQGVALWSRNGFE